jgi:hypothetical protein
VQSTMAGVGGNQRRRQRCRSKLARSSHNDNAAPAVDAGCFPKLDPLGLEPRVSLVLPAWIDPMLEEFSTSHREARALLDTCSPATIAQCTTDMPSSLPV